MAKRVNLTPAQRREVLERDHFECVKCGRGGRFSDWILEVDHINDDPSDNRPKNLQTLCVKCHNTKHPWRWNKANYRVFTFAERKQHFGY